MLLSARGARGPDRVNVPATAGQASPSARAVAGERPVVPRPPVDLGGRGSTHLDARGRCLQHQRKFRMDCRRRTAASLCGGRE